MKAGAIVLAIALLAACTGRPPAAPPPVDQPQAGRPVLAATAPVAAEVASVADQPLPKLVEAVSEATAAPVMEVAEVAEAVMPDAPPPPPVEPVVAAAAVELIVRWEVTSPAFYERRLIRPIWPGGASGVTWCVGYDGGHQIASVILEDWAGHPHASRLATTAGVRGGAAKTITPRYRDILTPYAECVVVFSERTLIEYERRTSRAFGDGYVNLRPLARGALVSLVYNRGAAMSGDSRREMRAIRDECIPAQDYRCIADQIRSMKRLWRGTTVQNGLYARREAEALLVEKS